MKYKRLIAYLIDFAILCFFIFLVSFLMQNDNTSSLQIEMSILNEQFLTKKVDFMTYLNYYSIILYDLDRQRILPLFMSFIFMVLYYIIFPYKNKGRTLGKMVMHLEVYKEGEIYIDTYIIRCLLANGLAYLLLSFFLLFILPSFSYFLTVSILGIFQIVLVLVSAFMILYKKDGRTLHDILTSSDVREYDEVKK